MPNATVRANAQTMPKSNKLTEADFIDDLAYLPDRYAMVCVGDCLAPKIVSGACLIFDKLEHFNAGDFVIVYRRRDVTPAGAFQGIVKRLVIAPPSWVTFPWRKPAETQLKALLVVEQLNPRQQFAIPCENLLGVHKCLGVASPELKRVKMALPDACRVSGRA